MTKEIITRSSCLHFIHPSENVSGSGDYMQVWIKDLETEEEELIFQGEKWNKEDFDRKLQAGRAPLSSTRLESEIKSDE